MTEAIARARARRLAGLHPDSPEAASIRAAMRAGGYDPDRLAPDEPKGYMETAWSNDRAYNPAWLNNRELSASIEAYERALGGMPF